MNGKLSERLAVVSQIAPVSTSSTVTGDVIDMSKFDEVLFTVMTGVITNAQTVDATIYGDTASGGTFATAITGKSLTPISGSSQNNSPALIRVSAAEVGAQGLRYIRPSLTASGAALVAIVAHATATYNPASDYDLASVVEIVG